MENLYFGLAAAGAIALLALLLIRKTKQTVKQPYQAPITTPITENRLNETKPIETIPQKREQRKKSVQLQMKKIKTVQQIESQYSGLYFGSFRLKASNSIHKITAMDFKGPKLLISTSKNQLILFNLKEWKKANKNAAPQKYFVSLDNNGASAVCIGQKYYYAALTFDKTIIIYEFVGEAGVYFKEVYKFNRNILKSNASVIHVDRNQKYIITAGTGADTVLDVWSIKGEKLASINSFQIQHYQACCGLKDIMVRGWTSQIKIFKCIEEKDGSFKKLQKQYHLPHSESPLSASICNRDMYAVSIQKNHKPKIWSLFQPHHPQLSTSALPQKLLKCSLYTFQPAIGHFKTLVVLSHENGFVITDINLNIINSVEGIDVQQIYMNGTNKLVLLGVINGHGQLMLWNLTKQVQKVKEINL